MVFDGTRYIRPKKGNSAPSNWVVVDTETLPTDHPVTGNEFHQLRLGVARSFRLDGDKLTRRKSIEFVDADAFWNWLTTRLKLREPVWLCAHNLPFDLSVLDFWKQLELGEYGFTRSSVGLLEKKTKEGNRTGWRGFFAAADPPTILSLIHRNGCRVMMVDTLNWFRCPLADLGDRAGLPKMEMPDFAADDQEWFEYCTRDVEILERTICDLVKWWRANRLGVFKTTAAACALESFRRRFQDRWIELHEDPLAKRLERESYYGGRLELFYRGKVPLWEKTYVLDVNSLYPFIMRDALLPYELRTTGVGMGSLNHSGSLEDAVARVTVNVEKRGLPYRCPSGLIFPHGHYETTLAGPELVRAVDDGCVEHISEWALYRRAKLFERYVQFFADMRDDCRNAGDQVGESFAKLLHNSLYGKWGQKSIEWLDLPDEIPDKPWGEWHVYSQSANTQTRYRGIGKLKQVYRAKGEHRKAFPAISAWITAAAREYMRQLLELVGDRNCYYIVTDALHVNQAGYDNLVAAGVVDQHRMGALKIVTESISAEYRNIHDWTVGTVTRHGGRRIDAIQINPTLYRQRQFDGLATAIRSEPEAGVQVRQVLKSVRTEYDRGTVGPDGWITPLAFNGVPLNLRHVRRPVA